jgi:hypothetical protein
VLITISGTSYRAACSPQASRVPEQEAWPVPSRKLVARGMSYTYTGDAVLAIHIAAHLEDAAEQAPRDPAVRQALQRDAARVRELLKEHGHE